MKRILITIFAVFATIAASAQYKTITDIPYRTDSSVTGYRQERCKLDVYYPENAKEPFKTIVWVHGGALMYLLNMHWPVTASGILQEQHIFRLRVYMP